MIQPGQKLDTSFTVKGFQGGGTRETTFGALLTRPTIVSVYMKNMTPSCDRQNDDLVAHAAEFERLGYTLIALSRDTCGSHARYAAAKKIGYALVSDPDDRFARAANAIVEKKMYGRTFFGPARAAYVFAADGTVLAVVGKVDPPQHAKQLRAILPAL